MVTFQNIVQTGVIKVMPIAMAVLLFMLGGCGTGDRNQEAKQGGDSTESLEGKTAAVDEATLGKLVSTIDFQVQTDDLENFENGRMPWIRIDSPEVDLLHLINKDEVVIPESRVALIIDYPLKAPFAFMLFSDKGFTRGTLIRLISYQYRLIYEEEENTAKTKTLPPGQRKIINRNTTDGIYGIWGHDIGDLVLTEVDVYRNSQGTLTLILQVDS